MTFYVKYHEKLQCSNSRCKTVRDRAEIKQNWRKGKCIYWFECADCGYLTQISVDVGVIGPMPVELLERDKNKRVSLAEMRKALDKGKGN